MSKKKDTPSNKSRLLVRKNLCLGCGMCSESCPRQAISLQSGQAEIDQRKCNQCGLCLDACLQGAIVQFKPISIDELRENVALLKDRANDIAARIERLKGINGELEKEAL